jgi:hypothetical protein
MHNCAKRTTCGWTLALIAYVHACMHHYFTKHHIHELMYFLTKFYACVSASIRSAAKGKHASVHFQPCTHTQTCTSTSACTCSTQAHQQCRHVNTTLLSTSKQHAHPNSLHLQNELIFRHMSHNGLTKARITQFLGRAYPIIIIIIIITLRPMP